jgi:hypothetical protein
MRLKRQGRPMSEKQYSALEIAREEILLILNELKDEQNPITIPIIDNELINSILQTGFLYQFDLSGDMNKLVLRKNIIAKIRESANNVL